MCQDLLKVRKLIENEEMRLDRERSAIQDLMIRECPECDESECERFQDQYRFINARIHQMKVFNDLFCMEFYHDIKEAEKEEEI